MTVISGLMEDLEDPILLLPGNAHSSILSSQTSTPSDGHRANCYNGRTDKVIRRKQFINMQLTQKTAMFYTKGFTSAEVETFLGSLYLGELEREEGRDVIGLAGNKLPF